MKKIVFSVLMMFSLCADASPVEVQLVRDDAASKTRGDRYERPVTKVTYEDEQVFLYGIDDYEMALVIVKDMYGQVLEQHYVPLKLSGYTITLQGNFDEKFCIEIYTEDAKYYGYF